MTTRATARRVRAADALPTGPLAPRSTSAAQPLPVVPGTERTLGGFDHVLSTLPLPVVTLMDRRDERMWQSPFFRRLGNLRSAVTCRSPSSRGGRCRAASAGP